MAVFFDAGLHADGISSADADSLRAFDVGAALLLPTEPEGAPSAKRLLHSFDTLLRVSRPRLESAGLRTVVALGVGGSSLPSRGLGEVLAAIPALCSKAPVVALGPLGLERGGPAEESALLEQLELAQNLTLSVWVSTPREDRERVTRRTLSVIKDSGFPPERLLLIAASLKLLTLTREFGHVAGLSLHPDDLRPEEAVAVVRRLGAERLALVSRAGSGAADLLAVPRAAHLLKTSGISEKVIQRVCATNAAGLFGDL